MENQFDRKAIEALEERTIEAVEAITWPLNVGDDLKSFDEQGDLVYVRKENDKIIYNHTSNRQEGQPWVVYFELPLVAVETAQEAQTEVQPEVEADQTEVAKDQN